MAEIKFINPNEGENYNALSTALGLAGSIIGIKQKFDEADDLKRKTDIQLQKFLKDSEKEKIKEQREAVKFEQEQQDRVGLTLPQAVKSGFRPATKEDKNPVPVPILQNDGSVLTVPMIKQAGIFDELGQQLKATTLAKSQKELAQGTGDERKAAGYANRLEQAESEFQKLQAEGFDPTTFKAAAQRADVTGLSKTDPIRRQEQAERNFVNSILRRESGAAISKSEFQSAEQQYFPRRGDSADVIEQKARNRALALENLKQEAGSAFKPLQQKAPQTQAAPSKGVFDFSGDEIERAIIKKQGLKAGIK